MCWESEEKVDTTLISASQETVILILRKEWITGRTSSESLSSSVYAKLS